MSYVEFLRVRKAFSIYAVIVAVVALVIIVSLHLANVHHVNSNVSVTIGSDVPRHGESLGDQMSHGKAPIPLGFLLGIAGYFAAAFGTVVAASLNRENERAGFVFTRPMSRVRLALSYIAVDVVGILAAFVYALVVFCAAPLASLGLLSGVVVDSHALAIAFLGVGIALLWYAVLQALTAGYRGRGGKFVGFSWLVFSVLSALTGVTLLGPIFHDVVMALNLVNPFAYFAGLSPDRHAPGEVVVHSVFDLSIATRVAMTWSLAAAGCAIAVLAWKRVEV